ncbi:MAG: arylesterase [Candidatus Omnitrophica bacterium]|nr:arylesterase [Candidatus Omnitrophota bacterium]
MRRNRLWVLLFYSSIVLLLNGCVKREIKNIDSKGTNIICFGDSLTFGYGVGGGEDYPSALAKMLDIPVINAGIDGDTSTEALKRIGSDVLNRKPLLVILEFGGNDFLRKVPKEVTVDNVRQMVREIQKAGAMVAVVDISAGLFLRDYRILLSRIARQDQAIFVPAVLSGIITDPTMKSDFIHPNGEGYKLIAERIHRAISPYLEKQARSKSPKK